jgi:hypothetical protein
MKLSHLKQIIKETIKELQISKSSLNEAGICILPKDAEKCRTNADCALAEGLNEQGNSGRCIQGGGSGAPSCKYCEVVGNDNSRRNDGPRAPMGPSIG